MKHYRTERKVSFESVHVCVKQLPDSKMRALVILHLISALISSECHRKRFKMPEFEIYPNTSLPGDHQITAYLLKGEPKRFFYTSQVNHGALSATLTTCTSPIRWSFDPDNSTILTTETMDTYHVRKVSKGEYTLQLMALERNTFVHIYVSTEEGGPQALQNAKFTNLRLVKRQRRKKLTVKWNPSLVDPQGTDYCLIVTTKQFQGPLCSIYRQSLENNPLVACVGRKTHYTLSNLHQNQTYHFNLFAINHQSNFTYPLGTASGIFDTHFKPATLKDSKPSFANLKKLDGKAVFRYKVGKRAVNALDLFITPCGGAVDVQVTVKGATVVPTKRIEGFGHINVTNPKQLGRYYVKIFALNREELKKTTGVEIYATTKSLAKIPLPAMPQMLELREYESLKTCDSVTVGWVAASVRKAVHYCIVVKEGKIRENDGNYKMPNQCGLDKRLKKSADFIIQYCRDVKVDREKAIVQKIERLKPGKNYIVQVTVKKPRGKTLSYKLLQVYTKPSCSRRYN